MYRYTHMVIYALYKGYLLVHHQLKSISRSTTNKYLNHQVIHLGVQGHLLLVDHTVPSDGMLMWYP